MLMVEKAFLCVLSTCMLTDKMMPVLVIHSMLDTNGEAEG